MADPLKDLVWCDREQACDWIINRGAERPVTPHQRWLENVEAERLLNQACLKGAVAMSGVPTTGGSRQLIDPLKLLDVVLVAYGNPRFIGQEEFRFYDRDTPDRDFYTGDAQPVWRRVRYNVVGLKQTFPETQPTTPEQAPTASAPLVDDPPAPVEEPPAPLAVLTPSPAAEPPPAPALAETAPAEIAPAPTAPTRKRRVSSKLWPRNKALETLVRLRPQGLGPGDTHKTLSILLGDNGAPVSPSTVKRILPSYRDELAHLSSL
jgi:hypothetical protein